MFQLFSLVRLRFPRALTCQSVNKQLQRTKTHKQTFLHPKDNEIPKRSIVEVRKRAGTQIGVKNENYDPEAFQKLMKSRAKLSELLPKSQDECPDRTISDSYYTAVIPVYTDEEVRDAYLVGTGKLRKGKILEDLDAFAVMAGYKHIKYPNSYKHQLPYGILTIGADNIRFAQKILSRGKSDLRMTGHVIYAGVTSMTVACRIDQQDEQGNWSLVSTSDFSLVAVDMNTRRPIVINRLVASSPEEKVYLDNIKAERKRTMNEPPLSGLVTPPNDDERIRIQKCFYGGNNYYTFENPGIRYGDNIHDAITITDTKMELVELALPEDRNIYYTIFGGTIIRNSHDKAFCSAWVYSRQEPQPTLVYAKDLQFKIPIPLGGPVKYTSMVGYAYKQYIVCYAHNLLLNLRDGSSTQANEFFFVFKAAMDAEMPPLVARTYEETLLYIDCRRRFKQIVENGDLKLDVSAI